MKSEKTRRPGRILNIVIVILAIAFAASLAGAVSEIRDARTGYRDKEEYLMMHLTDREYTDLYRRYIDNGVGNEPAEGVPEFYAVGRFYGLEFYRNAYEQAGLDDLAEEAEDLQEDVLAEMGEFADEAEGIRELFR